MPAMTESTAARAPTPTVRRDAKGKWLPGVSGHPGGDAARARKALNAATIAEMHRAFREGGRAAILKVMRNQPAVFLKLLVLLVPRELEVTRSGGLKALSDEELERGIEMITAMLAARDAGASARVIQAEPEPVALPVLSRKPRRKRGAEAKASPLLLDGQGESE
jgi:hypothetical protein